MDKEHFNYTAFMEQVLLEGLLLLTDEQRSELCREITKDYGSYDTYSLVYTDAYDEVKQLLEDCSDELGYYLRRCAFTAGRTLNDVYGISESLTVLLNKGIKNGIEQMADFVTEEDLNNDRIMDNADISLPAILITLCTELLSRTPEEVFGEEKPKGTVPA